MANAETQPIVIRRIYRKEGHHGGSWKVAFADFATALMAFFLLMWLLGSATEQQQQGIAEYFQNPAGVQGAGGASVSAIDLGGGMDGPAAPELRGEEGPISLPSPMQSAADSIIVQSAREDQSRLEKLSEIIQQAIAESEALEPYEDQLLLDITPEGLRIQLVDQNLQSMFPVGSADLQQASQTMIGELGTLINSVPNRVSITGHTDGRAFNRANYSNWELSSDRANAARRALIDGGMDPDKVGQIVGLGSSVLFDPADPLNPINRRISIVVLNQRAEQSFREQQPLFEPGATAGIDGN